MTAPKLKIKKGDQVIVLTGKDKGTKGEVLQVFPKESRVVVAGVNQATKHEKPSAGNPQGGLKKIDRPVHVSNVALADPKSGKPTRVGYTTLKDGKKVRIARKSGETIA